MYLRRRHYHRLDRDRSSVKEIAAAKMTTTTTAAIISSSEVTTLSLAL